MFTTLTIKNFRAFDSFHIDKLARINVIVGANDVGKTCLLEAVFLHVGAHNPELSLRLNAFRGLDAVRGDADETWGWLFHDKNTEGAISIETIDDASIKRTLEVTLEVQPTRIPTKNGGKLPSERSDAESTRGQISKNKLQYRFLHATGEANTTHALFAPEGLQLEIGRAPVIPNGFFLGTRLRSSAEEVERYSRLEQQGRQNEIRDILKIIEPRLIRLVVAVSGGSTIMMGDIGIGRLIPVALLGEGFVKVLSLTSTILNATTGCVLIDEIENGLHHSVHTKIWEALNEACRRAQAQLFVTTHSRECLLAAFRAFAQTMEFERSFSAYRLERGKQGVQAILLPPEALENAEKLDWEVR